MASAIVAYSVASTWRPTRSAIGSRFRPLFCPGEYRTATYADGSTRDRCVRRMDVRGSRATSAKDVKLPG